MKSISPSFLFSPWMFQEIILISSSWHPYRPSCCISCGLAGFDSTGGCVDPCWAGRFCCCVGVGWRGCCGITGGRCGDCDGWCIAGAMRTGDVHGYVPGCPGGTGGGGGTYGRCGDCWDMYPNWDGGPWFWYDIQGGYDGGGGGAYLGVCGADCCDCRSCGVNLYSTSFTYSLSLISFISLPCDFSRCIIGNNAFLVSLTSDGHCWPIPRFSLFNAVLFSYAVCLTDSLTL